MDYNMYVLQELEGEEPSVFDKIISVYEKIEKVIKVAKMIFDIASKIIPLFAVTMQYNINSSDPTEVLLAMDEVIQGNGYTVDLYTKAQVDELLQQYSPSSDLSNYYTKTQIDNTCMMKNRTEIATNEIHIGNADSTFTGSTVYVDRVQLNSKYITDFEEGTQATGNTTVAVSKQYCDETYQPLTTMANYLTTSAASSTYQTKTDAATDYSTLTSALTAQGISISQCLTTSDAASTYQPLSGMSNYLTTTVAASTYQTKTDANSDYGALTNAITDLGTHIVSNTDVILSSCKFYAGSIKIYIVYYSESLGGLVSLPIDSMGTAIFNDTFAYVSIFSMTITNVLNQSTSASVNKVGIFQVNFNGHTYSVTSACPTSTYVILKNANSTGQMGVMEFTNTTFVNEMMYLSYSSLNLNNNIVTISINNMKFIITS